MNGDPTGSLRVFCRGAIYCAFRHGAGIEMRGESRRYGLCDGIMQISHPPLRVFVGCAILRTGIGRDAS